MACQITQDMPPAGGYRPIPFKRVPPKTLLSGYGIFAGYLAMTAGAVYLYNLTHKQIVKNEVEMRSAQMAIYPMLLAERDREFLKQCRRNRNAEKELMKDVPGWEVGKYFSEPIYKNIAPDQYVEPNFFEYYAHADPWDFSDRVNLKMMS